MMSRNPLVSIVIPAYNLGRYLGEAIESVLSQEYKNIELIVLDDGSTDNTRSVLDKYAGRIYAETQPNIGQAKTLNKGWRMSKGDILGFISADDALLPGAVTKSVACFAAHAEAVLTYCDFKLIDADSRPIRRVRTPEFNYDEMLVEVICPPGPGAFFRRSASSFSFNTLNLNSLLDIVSFCAKFSILSSSKCCTDLNTIPDFLFIVNIFRQKKETRVAGPFVFQKPSGRGWF